MLRGSPGTSRPRCQCESHYSVEGMYRQCVSALRWAIVVQYDQFGFITGCTSNEFAYRVERMRTDLFETAARFDMLCNRASVSSSNDELPWYLKMFAYAVFNEILRRTDDPGAYCENARFSRGTDTNSWRVYWSEARKRSLGLLSAHMTSDRYSVLMLGFVMMDLARASNVGDAMVAVRKLCDRLVVRHDYIAFRFMAETFGRRLFHVERGASRVWAPVYQRHNHVPCRSRDWSSPRERLALPHECYDDDPTLFAQWERQRPRNEGVAFAYTLAVYTSWTGRQTNEKTLAKMRKKGNVDEYAAILSNRLDTYRVFRARNFPNLFALAARCARVAFSTATINEYVPGLIADRVAAGRVK